MIPDPTGDGRRDDPVTGPAETGTVLGLGPGSRLLLGVGGPAAGFALGYFLPRVADWVTSLPWAPLQGPAKLIASLDGFWTTLACAVAGLVGGLWFAYAAITGTLRVTVTDGGIRLDKDEKTRTVSRSEVDSVFVDGKQLVVLDRESRQLVRDAYEASPAEVAAAFRAHGYPWVDRDPFAELYRRWVPGAPELPPGVNAVLAARSVALEKKVAVDIVELRDEVQKLGFVVRDEGTRQYWRPLVRS